MNVRDFAESIGVTMTLRRCFIALCLVSLGTSGCSSINHGTDGGGNRGEFVAPSKGEEPREEADTHRSEKQNRNEESVLGEDVQEGLDKRQSVAGASSAAPAQYPSISADDSLRLRNQIWNALIYSPINSSLSVSTGQGAFVEAPAFITFALTLLPGALLAIPLVLPMGLVDAALLENDPTTEADVNALMLWFPSIASGLVASPFRITKEILWDFPKWIFTGESESYRGDGEFSEITRSYIPIIGVTRGYIIEMPPFIANSDQSLTYRLGRLPRLNDGFHVELTIDCLDGISEGEGGTESLFDAHSIEVRLIDRGSGEVVAQNSSNVTGLDSGHDPNRRRDPWGNPCLKRLLFVKFTEIPPRAHLELRINYEINGQVLDREIRISVLNDAPFM